MILKTNILTPISPDKYKYIPNAFITIENSKIQSISLSENNKNFLDFSNCVCVPGFIDTHVHLSQFHARGKHSSNLLDWLNKFIFKEEYKSKDTKYAYKLTKNFFMDSIKAGTTTSVIYTAPYKHACEIAFKEAKNSGVRALIGNTLMDTNSPDYLQKDTEKSINESFELFEKWNKSTDLLEYIFSPRFAPVCSSKLMKTIGAYAKKNNAYIQTHLSENIDEKKWVSSLFPAFKNYTEVYEKHNLLGPKTLLGHAIHINEKEIEIIKRTKSKIIHCPDSNFFLKSGIFPWEDIKRSGIDFALASDVGAGTSLSMLNVMKMCNYRQDNYVISPEEALYYATLGGAKVLGKEDIIGSIEIGKDADLTFIEIDNPLGKSGEEILSILLYIGNELKVKSTFVAGKAIY